MTSKWETKATKKKPHKAGLRRILAIISALVAVGCLAVLARDLFKPRSLVDLLPAGTTPAPTAQNAQNPAGQRAAREASYQKDVETLKALAQDGKADEKTRGDAGAQLAKLVEQHRTEAGLEAALEAAGFSPTLVLLQNEALTVVVPGDALTDAQSAEILSLCVTHSNAALQNIRIMTD